MSPKKLIAAAAVAVCGTSFAQYQPPGVLGPIVDSTVLIANLLPGGQSSFGDIYEFTVTTPSTASALVIDNPASDGRISSLTGLAFADLGNNLLNLPGAVDLNPADGLAVQSALDAGTYHLLVAGGPTADLGGLYVGAINVTAVPEPATLALLLAGVMVVGGAARFRRG